MRSIAFTVLFLALAANPNWAFAIHGGHGGNNGGGNSKYATLNVVNNVDAAVDIRVNGQYAFTLEPTQSAVYSAFIDKGNKASVTVTANLADSPTVTGSGSASITSGQSATATITSASSSALQVTFSGSGLAGNFGRDGGAMLASTGGLLPLLWFSCLLGRRPRRRESC